MQNEGDKQATVCDWSASSPLYQSCPVHPIKAVNLACSNRETRLKEVDRKLLQMNQALQQSALTPAPSSLLNSCFQFLFPMHHDIEAARQRMPWVASKCQVALTCPCKGQALADSPAVVAGSPGKTSPTFHAAFSSLAPSGSVEGAIPNVCCSIQPSCKQANRTLADGRPL